MTLTAADFTWDYIYEVSTWPMAHMFNPFIIELLFQNPLLTLLIVWVWESIEVLGATLFNGKYIIFVGDGSQGYEGVTDSLLGDTSQGVLGMLLARMVIFAWNVPSWTPSISGPYRIIVFKRLLQYLVWVAPLSFTNSSIKISGSRDFHWGIYVISLTTILCIYSWYITGKSDLEYRLWWNRYSELEQRQVYFGIMFNSFVLLSTTFVFVWVPFFQVYLAWLILMIVNLFVAIINGRGKFAGNMFSQNS